MSLLNDPFVQQLTNLFTLKAFRPDPFDMTATLKERYDGRSLLGIVIYPQQVKVAKIHFIGKLHIEMIGITKRETDDERELIRILNQIAQENPGMEAAIAYNYSFNAVKSFTIKRSDEINFHLKDMPQKVLGDDYEPEHEYSIINHPSREQAIVFSYDRAALNNIERSIENTELKVVRLQHVVGSLFAYVFAYYKGLFPHNVLIISGSSVFYLEVDPTTDHEWQLMRNRAENPLASNVELKRQINLLNQVLPRNDTIIFCLDQRQDQNVWEERIRELRPQIKFEYPIEDKESLQTLIFHALAHD